MFAKHLRGAFALLLSVLLLGSAIAATERYDYDPLGRLIRVIDASDKATEYVYDAAGNILEVRAAAALTVPVVSSITPSFIRRGETKAFTITGTGFLGANVSVVGDALDISDLQLSATQIKFNLSVTANAPIGNQPINISSAAGSAIANVNVGPLLPKVSVDPSPLAIPPDNVSRIITIRLSNVDAVEHTISLSATNTNIQVTPASITIPAGQLSVSANIRGLVGGQSTITLASSTLGTTLVPVFITAEFVGITTSIAPILGVVLEGTSQGGSTQSIPMVSRALGVVFGSAITSLSPSRLQISSGPSNLVINGLGLSDAQSVSIEPPTGITIGAPVIGANGTSVSVPVTVADNAVVGLRRIVVKNAAGVAYSAASATADRLNIVRAEPVITSVDPLFGLADTTITLTVRGTNLHEASAVLFNPSAGIVTDAAPIISSDGTVLTAGVALAINAGVGDHVVSVITPTGTSTINKNVSNTFKVVNEIRESVTPVIAPIVGVVLQDSTTPPSPPIHLTSTSLGVGFGAFATKLIPAVGIVGQSMTLTVHGSELSGVTAISLIPNTGLTVGQMSIAPDGKTASLPISVAIDAPQTVRSVRVMAGNSEISFASAAASLFQVSLPLPEVDSITPIALQIGQAPIALIVRGRNLYNSSQIKVSPNSGLSISTPPLVNEAGTEAIVNVSAALDAIVGQRLVSIVTPAGESSVTSTPSNTLTLLNVAELPYTFAAAPLVGVIKLDNSETPNLPIGPIVSPAVGIVVENVPTPISTATTQFSKALGITFGSVVESIDVSDFSPGFTGTLILRGHELNGLVSGAVSPSTGITFGAPVNSTDGKQSLIPISVDATAVRGPRMLKVVSVSGNIEFSNPLIAKLQVGPGTPQLDSITPILAEQGDVVTMTIRGQNLFDVKTVTAIPSNGFSFVPGTLTTDAAGTLLNVQFVINPDAAIGSRVIQVVVPGAASNEAAVSANTFTVFAK